MRSKLGLLFLVFFFFVSMGTAWAAHNVYHVPLTGDQVPVETDNSGVCVGSLDTDTNVLDMICVHTIPDASAAHIHAAPAGEPGSVVFDFSDPSSGVFRGEWAMTSEDVDALDAQGLYVMVHSQSIQTGELRGQIGPAADQGVAFGLDEGQIPAAGGSFRAGETGHCAGVLTPSNKNFMLGCHHDVVDATAAHIHMAPAGETGPVWFGLSASTAFVASVNMDNFEGSDDYGDFERELRAGNLYVNIHSSDMPAGKIRGQIPVPPRSMYFPQFGNGDGFKSDLVFINPSVTTAVNATAYMQDPNGMLMAVGIVGNGDPSPAEFVPLDQVTFLEFTTPPLGKVSVSTDGEGSIVDQLGSVKVISDGILGGIVRFDVPAEIPGSGIVGLPDAPALTAAMAPVRMEESGINTALAVRNPEPYPVTIVLQLRNEDGELPDIPLVGIKEIEIPANGRIAQFVTEIFGITQVDFEGVAIITAEMGSFAAIALEQGPDAGEFTALPVTPIE